MLPNEKALLENKYIETKVTAEEYDKINDLITSGLFLNNDDFLRQAIRDKLESYGEEIVLRNIPYTQMKEEIIDYVKKNPEVDALDIADALLLDVFEVNDILVELIEEEIISYV